MSAKHALRPRSHNLPTHKPSQRRSNHQPWNHLPHLPLHFGPRRLVYSEPRRTTVLTVEPAIKELSPFSNERNRLYFATGFVASNRISFKNSTCFCNSVFPTGNLLKLNKYANTSASCCLVNFASAPCGIVLRIRSNKSPTVSPFQFERNVPPVSGAAPPPPTSVSPWQEAHSFRYISSPRLACSSVYTPSQTDREVDAPSCALATITTTKQIT